jgi:hypothetical protein
MATRFNERCRKPVSILPGAPSDLITFTDVKDPKSVVLVDPFHLAATRGEGVSRRSMTLEVTDEPLTKGIDNNLPWARGYDRNIQAPGVESLNSLETYVNRRGFILEK